jgi:hypothetical protein
MTSLIPCREINYINVSTFFECTSIYYMAFIYQMKTLVFKCYSNVRGGGICEAISDGAGVSL